MFVLLLFLPLVSFASNCKFYSAFVRKAHRFYFGVDYPYWFSVAQLKVESNCRWVRSRDGHGSVGPAQITPKFWDEILRQKYPFWGIKPSQYFMAHAYILWKMHKRNKCKSLFITYQCYNRSCYKVLKETKGCCSWYQGYEVCKRTGRNICVWRSKTGKCLQYRSECDINYNYSRKIYKYGKRMTLWKTNRWRFW